MIFIKKFNEATKEYNSLDLIFNWVYKRYSAKCNVIKTKDDDNEVRISLECTTPIRIEIFLIKLL